MERDFKRKFMGEWVMHDYIACDALKEYESTADYAKSPYRHMADVAARHGTTIQKMKEHHRCIQ